MVLPALGRKAKCIFKAVIVSLPGPEADSKSEPDELCVSYLAQAAAGPSSGFSVQDGEVLLPSLHSVLKERWLCLQASLGVRLALHFAMPLVLQSHSASDQVS